MAQAAVPRTAAGIAIDQGMDGGAVANVRAYGSSATDNSSFVDEYSFTEQERKDYGIGDHERVVIPARNEVRPRRFEQIRRKYGEARVLRNVTTGEDPYAHTANQAVIVPAAAVEEHEKRRQRAAAEYLSKFKPDSKGNYVLKEELFEQDEHNLTMRRQLNAERFALAGIGEGSETAGMSFEEGLAYYKRTGRDPSRLAELARENGQHRADNREQWQSTVSGKAPSFAVKAEFAPKVNPKSALGQIQARNAKK